MLPYLFFQCLSKFSVFTPQPRPSSSDSVQRQPPTIGQPRGVGTCEKNKQQQTTFPTPPQKQAIMLKTKHGSTDRRGYNNYFLLTNSELILGLFLAARLTLETKGKANHAFQRAQLCSMVTSSLGSRLCRWLKQQLRALWTPLHMIGKLLLFPALGTVLPQLLTQCPGRTSGSKGKRNRGGTERRPTNQKATSHVALSAEHARPHPHFMLKLPLATDVRQPKTATGKKTNPQTYKPRELHSPWYPSTAPGLVWRRQRRFFQKWSYVNGNRKVNREGWEEVN